ncbi:hypothetical protein Cpar_1240 [Chlorobaculum parvum NCIB 8327]|uniref:Uncharacterized protein n=1 Tax=Chlorobaculum parvum (strain DSM 263 / NCIMB 8327) TaxID=517417 RepID=B3QNZ2_CHLP8|nr:hypothetical protein Cpar_1240 [Chlorobaculum parvum NCIB 8327]
MEGWRIVLRVELEAEMGSQSKCSDFFLTAFTG